MHLHVAIPTEPCQTLTVLRLLGLIRRGPFRRPKQPAGQENHHHLQGKSGRAISFDLAWNLHGLADSATLCVRQRRLGRFQWSSTRSWQPTSWTGTEDPS
jgi:hypothetical protein